jgi:hypothetical protein
MSHSVVLALMHALVAPQVIPWKLACTACCTARLYNLVDEFRSQDFGLKLNWEAPMGSDLVYSILSPRMGARPASTRLRYWTARTPVPWNRFVQVGVYGGSGAGSASGFQSQHTNVGCLAGFV